MTAARALRHYMGMATYLLRTTEQAWLLPLQGMATAAYRSIKPTMSGSDKVVPVESVQYGCRQTR